MIKRFAIIILCVILTLSILPVSVFASDIADNEAYEAQEITASETTNFYVAIDTDVKESGSEEPDDVSEQEQEVFEPQIEELLDVDKNASEIESVEKENVAEEATTEVGTDVGPETSLMEVYGVFEYETSDSVTSIANGTCGDDLTWILYDDGKLFISGTGTMTDYTVEQAPWYSYHDDITSIILEDGLESIGNYAFHLCSNLTTINLPDGLTRIGDHAFAACYSLTTIRLPNSLTSIEGWAFHLCKSLTTIDLPDHLTSIGDHAFHQCNNLTTIELPDGLTSLGGFAFYGCNNLTAINLPDGLTSIREYTFFMCESLTAIDLPDGLTSIGEFAFYGTSLTAIDLPDGLTSIGDGAFYGTHLTTFDWPDGWTSIGANMFCGCQYLTTIYLPDSLTSIGESAFNGCSSLTTIDLPDGLNIISDEVFFSCRSLTEISIPEGVTSIGRSAFRSCTNLKAITLPDSLTSISDRAFQYCASLADIYYGGSEEEWETVTKGSYNTCLDSATFHYATASCLGHTITLDESIRLNYYISIPDRLFEDIGAKVVFTKNGETVSETLIKDAQLANKDGVTGYVFSCDLVTKEMADTVEATIVDSSGNTHGSYSYSAKQYCEELIELQADDAELVALVKALMNYGASAQEYFGYNTGNLVNSSLSAEDRLIGDITEGALSQYATTRGYADNHTNDISYYGVTLDLLSDMNMKLYFNIPEGKQISDYTFTITGDGDNPVVLDTGVGRYGPYARISGIYSADIDAEYTVNITYNGEQVGWVKTSPFAYVNSSLMLDSLEGNLRTLLCAMYHYNACANAYFGG